MSEKVPSQIKNAIDGVFALLKSGDLPKAIAKAVFPSDGKPCSAWSFSNRLFVAIDWVYSKYPEIKDKKDNGKLLYSKIIEAFEKMDYRGFRQWKSVKRHVLKGKEASYILAPNMKKFDKKFYRDEKGDKITITKTNPKPNDKREETESITFATSFRGVPVFSITDTEGKTVKYKKLKLPELPFKPVAKFLGITVIPKAFNNNAYGSFSPQTKIIELATPDESTFFHELAHAVDGYILSFKGKKLKGGQHKDQELVAQFSANVIAYMRGYKIKESTAYTKRYIESYAGKDADQEIIKLIARIERIVEFITNFKQAKSPNRQMEEKTGEPKSKTEELADNPKKPKKSISKRKFVTDEYGEKELSISERKKILKKMNDCVEK